MASMRKADRNIKPDLHLLSPIAKPAIIALFITTMVFAATAQSGEKIPPGASSQIPGAPRRHFRLHNPADLSPEEAEARYKKLRKLMARDYATSGIAAAKVYQKWQRYNTAPYRSAAHGRRYVNHYANAKARAYGNYEKAGKLPVGSVIAKDNLTVMSDGKTYPGALLLMEKMPADFNYVSGDWKYTMILPDGSLFGTTNGVGSNKVRFCIGCHLAVEKQDHLYFPPKRYRK